MLHIANCIVDDKFIDNVIDFFALTKKQCVHDYLLVTSKKLDGYKYISNTNEIKKICARDFIEYISKQNYDAIILHSLYSVPLHLIPLINKKIKILWFAWGYDIYTFEWGTPLVVLPDIYYPLTKKYVNKGFIGKFKKNIGKFFNKNEILEKAVSRVDYFSGVLPFEYELIMKNEFFHAKPIEFSYGKVDSYICEKDLYSPIVSGANILIGNSADPSNNHLDILDILTGLNLVGKKIVLPLSYGGSSGYKGHIMYVGKSLWGEGFIGLTTFIPFEEYRSIVNECQNVIFFHERQQAMGNIFLSLWNGSKVFLSDSSWVYRYLMKLGFVVYSVQKDLKEVELNQKISKDEVLNNRKLLLKYYSLDANLKKLELIYNKISI